MYLCGFHVFMRYQRTRINKITPEHSAIKITSITVQSNKKYYSLTINYYQLMVSADVTTKPNYVNSNEMTMPIKDRHFE